MDETKEEADEDPEEFEEMEAGEAAHVVSLEMYAPAHRSRSWVECIVRTTPGTGAYRLYLDGSNRFLLSAKRFGPDLFYISSEENFPLRTKIPKRKYIARIIERRGVFYLCMNSCALCDKTLGKYICGYDAEHREILAKITYAIRNVSLGGAEDVSMRCMLLAVPMLENKCRVVWCPRALNSSATCTFDEISHLPGITTRFVNRLPEWDSDLNSLSLKFHANRISCPSSKNFLIYEEKHMLSSNKKKLTANHATMQFGKSGDDLYCLDFKFPLSPLQAFGIALTTFAASSKC